MLDYLPATHLHTQQSLFFFNDTATTEIYTLSLHDALPISSTITSGRSEMGKNCFFTMDMPSTDRKSTRLNSSHLVISYAVFCLKKKTMGNLPTGMCSDS